MSATWQEKKFGDRTEWTRADEGDPRTIIEFRNRPGVWHIDEGNGFSHGEFKNLGEAQEHVERHRPIRRPAPGRLEARIDDPPGEARAITD